MQDWVEPVLRMHVIAKKIVDFGPRGDGAQFFFFVRAQHR
jgi:hypothetical protein